VKQPAAKSRSGFKQRKWSRLSFPLAIALLGILTSAAIAAEPGSTESALDMRVAIDTLWVVFTAPWYFL
jgi:hypothetical protein